MKGGDFEVGALREARDVPTEHAQRVRCLLSSCMYDMFCYEYEYG